MADVFKKVQVKDKDETRWDKLISILSSMLYFPSSNDFSVKNHSPSSTDPFMRWWSSTKKSNISLLSILLMAKGGAVLHK